MEGRILAILPKASDLGLRLAKIPSPGTLYAFMLSHRMISSLRCRFGGYATVATRANASAITCMTPRHSAIVVPVEVSLNNQDFTASKALFVFVPHGGSCSIIIAICVVCVFPSSSFMNLLFSVCSYYS